MKINKLILYIILLLFASIKIFHMVNQKGIFWDAAVYIGMGKYIFSLGKIGLWEPARPLLWPLILGLIWKMEISPILGGRIVELALGIGCIYIIYLIGKDAFNEKIALLSSLFLTLSPTFLFYTSSILTEIPSTFFALLSVYCLKKNHFLVGVFAAASIMTRFPQILILLPITLFILSKRKDIGKFILGMAIIILPYLALSAFLYKNPVYPFIFQIFMTKNTGWVYNAPFSFYIMNIIKENLLLVFAVLGAVMILKKSDKKKITILSILLIFLISFSLIKHKELRFIIVFLPYLCLVASYGVFILLSKINKKTWVMGGFLILFLLQAIPKVQVPMLKEYPEFRDYAKTKPQNMWISNPIFIVDENVKPTELVYYPVYNSNKIDDLIKSLPDAKNILIDTCDLLPCPQKDAHCEAKTSEFLTLLKSKFNIVYEKEMDNCSQFIFALL